MMPNDANFHHSDERTVWFQVAEEGHEEDVILAETGPYLERLTSYHHFKSVKLGWGTTAFCE